MEDKKMTATAIDRSRPTTGLGIMGNVIRRGLDAAYQWAAYLAGACMVMILLLTLTQIVTRYLGFSVRGVSDYGGYFMAAASFLAFAHTLNRGAHVRIEMVLSVLGRFRWFAETVSLGAASLIAVWFAYYSCDMVYWTYQFGDMSTGLDATPLWIPQLSMAVGAVLFAIAIADQFLQQAFKGAHSIASGGGH